MLRKRHQPSPSEIILIRNELKRILKSLQLEIEDEKRLIVNQKKLLGKTKNYLIRKSKDIMVAFHLKNIIDGLIRIINLEEDITYYQKNLRSFEILVKISGQKNHIKNP